MESPAGFGVNLRREVEGTAVRYLAETYPGYEIGVGSYGALQVYKFDDTTKFKIGNYCSFGLDTKILLGGEHRTDWVTTYPFSALSPAPEAQIPGHPGSKGDVIIGSDVWVGMGATILSGAQIGHGAVIGASTLVSGVVPPYAIYAGNPGRLLTYRFRPEVITKLLKLAWWNWTSERITNCLPSMLSHEVELFLSEEFPP